MRWLEVPLDDALASAETPVVIKFDASWCSMCVDLDREVLKTQAVDEVFGGMTGVRVDFDAPGARALVERYAILDLPTVVVVDPEGNERGRVSSFRDRATWLADARAAAEAEDLVGDVEARLADDPDDRGLQVHLAELLLSRDPARAEATLERLAWGDDGVAAHALFLLGRYHHRVLNDPGTARFVWRELALRFGDLHTVRGAFWWYALAQADLGRVEVGAAALRERVRRQPESAEAVIEWGRFVGRTQHEPDREAVRAAAMKVRARGPERAQLDELVLQLGRGFDGEPLPKL